MRRTWDDIKEVRTGYSGALRYQFRDPATVQAITAVQYGPQVMDAMRKMLEFKKMVEVKNKFSVIDPAGLVEAHYMMESCQHEIKDNGKCIECGAVEHQETPG